MIIINDHNHGHQIAKGAGFSYNPIVDQCISREVVGDLVGGVVYYNYTHASICMHVASFKQGWINVDLLWAAFDYPFNQLKCERIFAYVRAANQKALEFCCKLGFKGKAVLEGVYHNTPEGKGDLLIMSMKRHECRWLKIKPSSYLHGNKSNKQEAA